MARSTRFRSSIDEAVYISAMAGPTSVESASIMICASSDGLIVALSCVSESCAQLFFCSSADACISLSPR